MPSLFHFGGMINYAEFHLQIHVSNCVGSNYFPAQFIEIDSHYRGIGCIIGVLQRTACLVVHSVADGSFAFLFGCMPVGRASGSVSVPGWGLVC